jgi:hypothetical protein
MWGLPVYPKCQTSAGNDSSRSQSYITTDGQSASLSWCQTPIWDPQPNVILISLISFRELRVCTDVERSLRWEVWSVVFSWWTSPARSLSGLSPAALITIFYCLNFWHSPNIDGQVPVFISRSPAIHPGTVFPLHCLLLFAGLFQLFPTVTFTVLHLVSLFTLHFSKIKHPTHLRMAM